MNGNNIRSARIRLGLSTADVARIISETTSVEVSAEYVASVEDDVNIDLNPNLGAHLVIDALIQAIKKAELKVLVFPAVDSPEHPSKWVGHCLNYDVVMQGATIHSAISAVVEAVEETVEADIKGGIERAEAPSTEQDAFRLSNSGRYKLDRADGWTMDVVLLATPPGLSGSTVPMITAQLAAIGLAVVSFLHPDNPAALREATPERVVGHIRRIRAERDSYERSDAIRVGRLLLMLKKELQ